MASFADVCIFHVNRIKMSAIQNQTYLIGPEIQRINSRQPSIGDTLKLMSYHHFSLKKTIRHAARSVITDVVYLYRKEHIPFISEQNAARKLLKLNDTWIGLKKSKKRKSVKDEINKRNFCKKLDTLFDITPKNVFDTIQDPNAAHFLIAQRKDMRLGLRVNKRKFCIRHYLIFFSKNTVLVNINNCNLIFKKQI